MPASPRPARDLAHRLRLYEREARFYQDLASRVDIPTPRLYCCATDPESGAFVLLLEELPPFATALVDRLRRDRSVPERLATSPVTLTHSDMRVNNVMFTSSIPPEPCGLIDWQTVTRARDVTDISSLFVNNLQPSDRRVAEAELLPVYHRLLEENGVRGYSFEQCWIDYRLGAINQFTQMAVLSSLLNFGPSLGDQLVAATVGRPLAALVDLNPIELLGANSRWDRWFSLLRRPSRGTG